MRESHVYRGECLELLRELPSASVDVVLTDPPYCSGGFLEAQKQAARSQGIESLRQVAEGFEWFAADNMTTSGLAWLLRSVLVEARRVLRPDRGAFVFCDWRMVPALAQPRPGCLLPDLPRAGRPSNPSIPARAGGGGELFSFSSSGA